MAYDDVEGDYDIEGDDDVEGDEIVGLVKQNPRTGRRMIVRARPKPKGPALQLPAKPGWRKRGIGPGVSAPADDRLIVPLTPQTAGGLFAAAVNNIIYNGRPQKPFQGTRLLVKVVRTGASATGALLGQMFAGSDLQQGALGRFDVESIGSATAFDTGISMTPVEPGVDINLDVLITPAPAAADTVLLTMFLLGNIIH